MPRQYQKLFEETFQRPNENPLDNGHWEQFVPGTYNPLQLKSHRGIGTVVGGTFNAAYLEDTVPADQYVEATVGILGNELALQARAQVDGSNSYQLVAFSDSAIPGGALFAGGGTALSLFLSPFAVQPGDKMRVECLGSVITFLHNGAVVLTGSDAGLASGTPVIGLQPATSVDDTGFSHFEAGAIFSGVPFLGSVTEVGSAPAGDSDPFIGTVVVVGSAPAGVPNPYLGKIRVVVSPPAGRPNPALGQVVVVGSAPAGRPNPYLGNAVES